ncbi:arylsulfatase [Thermostilla marina]
MWRVLFASLLTIFSIVVASPCRAETPRPNIVLILADDMGYSDIGCFGGEIPTPNLDALARDGLRFTQFYNTSRCCPTRASLLTGLYQHQAGIGMMTTARPDAPPAYQGYLNQHCVTLAEVLKSAGYHTYMVGKWHVGMSKQSMWPCRRGFDRYYGILSGACDYFRPQAKAGLTLDSSPAPAPHEGYYTTDVFTDYAIRFLESQPDDAPFFLYVAYNAPHWPLQAKPEDVKKFLGKYLCGWDEIRKRRWKRQCELGIVDPAWGLSPRDPVVPAWDTLTKTEQKDLDARMATYAAQVHCMDYNIGRLVTVLRRMGKLENTLILFLSDNGACPEPWNDLNPTGTAHLGGGKFKDPNDPTKGGAWSYGQGWANASNTPFRRYKTKSHEGGISTPLIAYWPAGIRVPGGTIIHDVGHIRDIMPTVVELADAEYPTVRNGRFIHPAEGNSLVPIFAQGSRIPEPWLFWEHRLEGAVRHGRWKAIYFENTGEWKLYDMETDRTEQHDLSNRYPELLEVLKRRWFDWAIRCEVLPKTIE